ncbi:MAG TPA: hypothetical protein VHD55_02025 [Candidatus Paceibacterota bacterium]|nr:hypothetical protein [Candidatus Paceibacterota bacterium]
MNIFEIIGFIFLISAFLMGFGYNLFTDFLWFKWLHKWVPEQFRERKNIQKPFSLMASEYFKNNFFAFTSPSNPPDPMFQRPLTLLLPMILTVVSLMIAGISLVEAPFFECLIGVIVFLAISLFFIVRLAKRQIKNHTW